MSETKHGAVESVDSFLRKVEELLEAAKLALPCLPGDREYAEVVAGLEQATREVEAALGGKAE